MVVELRKLLNVVSYCCCWECSHVSFSSHSVVTYTQGGYAYTKVKYNKLEQL